MIIKLEDSGNVLKKNLMKKFNDKSIPLIECAFDFLVEFKSNYEIKSCLKNEEAEELLAEYGTCSWDPKGNPKFEFTLTRQIQLHEEDECYQI